MSMLLRLKSNAPNYIWSTPVTLYGDAKVALNNALGLSDRAPEYHLADILTYSPVAETVQPLITTALRLRPDMNILDDQAKALGAQIVQYKSDNYPTINAVGAIRP